MQFSYGLYKTRNLNSTNWEIEMQMQLPQTLVQLMVQTIVSNQNLGGRVVEVEILGWKVAEELNLCYLVSWGRGKLNYRSWAIAILCIIVYQSFRNLKFDLDRLG